MPLNNSQRNRLPISELRKRMAAAGASANKRRKFGASSVWRGTKGTRDFEQKMLTVERIAKGDPLNKAVAEKLLLTRLTLARNRYDIDVSGPGSDHQLLVNIALGIIAAHHKKRAFTPNAKQASLLERFS